MRLKEDSGSWRARGIIRRDFRHTHGDPEIDTTKVKGKKKRPKKNKHKHIWVEVEWQEYCRYANKHNYFPWWLYGTADKEPPYWTGYMTYYVCADCLDTKRKEDVGKRRAHYRRKYGWAW